jgi:hypothetical protein
MLALGAGLGTLLLLIARILWRENGKPETDTTRNRAGGWAPYSPDKRAQ